MSTQCHAGPETGVRSSISASEAEFQTEFFSTCDHWVRVHVLLLSALLPSLCWGPCPARGPAISLLSGTVLSCTQPTPFPSQDSCSRRLRLPHWHVQPYPCLAVAGELRAGIQRSMSSLWRQIHTPTQWWECVEQAHMHKWPRGICRNLNMTTAPKDLVLAMVRYSSWQNISPGVMLDKGCERALCIIYYNSMWIESYFNKNSNYNNLQGYFHNNTVDVSCQAWSGHHYLIYWGSLSIQGDITLTSERGHTLHAVENHIATDMTTSFLLNLRQICYPS